MDSFRERKFFIFFMLAYTSTGCDADAFSDIKDRVIDAAGKFKEIWSFLDATVEESCVFQCPTGVAPKPNWYHVPQSNGCGSLGIHIHQKYLPDAEMTKCCDTHDICYDICSANKDTCDLEFKRCLYEICEDYESTGIKIVNMCKAAAKVLFTGPLALGCKSYIDAQKKACYCGKSKW